MQVNKDFPNRSVNVSIPCMIGLSIRFNMFRNRRTNWNRTLCMCSHVFGNVWPVCSNPAVTGNPCNTLWSNPHCLWSNSKRNWPATEISRSQRCSIQTSAFASQNLEKTYEFGPDGTHCSSFSYWIFLSVWWFSGFVHANHPGIRNHVQHKNQKSRQQPLAHSEPQKQTHAFSRYSSKHTYRTDSEATCTGLNLLLKSSMPYAVNLWYSYREKACWPKWRDYG